MKNLIIAILIASLAIMVPVSPVQAEMANMDEALTVANNWISLIIEKEGNWGGSETAEVEEIEEFKRGERVIGYFCHVKPKGFIVVSLSKELAPVKAYSATCDLDPESDEGMADLLKGNMERILNWTEQLVGPIESARAEDLDSILEINYRQTWAELEGDEVIFKQDLESGEVEMNYEGGEPPLLTSSWHQEPPYNDQCPDKGCTWPPCYYNENALVGCVATAGAQTMRYWNWPPYGEEGYLYSDTYNWPNMPDTFTGCDWSQVQVHAVAELCREVGVAVGTKYGCKASSACFASCIGKDLLDAFEDHFRYSDAADDKDRDAYDSGVDWFNAIKTQLNVNRPIPYGVEDHAIVADGWQEVYIKGVSTRQYHMNYGWGMTGNCTTGCNAWYTLDELYLGGKDEEEMLVRIYPAPSLGSSLSGTYAKRSFHYRYFDQDATGHDAVFEAGQYLQFLPGITVKCTSPDGGKIQFRGGSTDNTYLFTRGDIISKGIRIHSGHIYLYNQGSIKFP